MDTNKFFEDISKADSNEGGGPPTTSQGLETIQEPPEPPEPHKSNGMSNHKALLLLDFLIALGFGVFLQDVVPGQNTFLADSLFGSFLVGTEWENLKFSAMIAFGIGAFSVTTSSFFWTFVKREKILEARMLFEWRAKLPNLEKNFHWWLLRIGYVGIISAEVFFFIKRLEKESECGPYCVTQDLSNFEMILVSIGAIFFTTIVGVFNAIFITKNDGDADRKN